MFTASLAAAAAALSVPAAMAGDVRVEVRGTVDYNVIAGSLAPVPDGAPVSMSFEVNSADFLSSSNFPTRGYRIELGTFNLAVGGVQVPIVQPQPNAAAYFVLRNNDPAVDGFFISQGDVELPRALAVSIPGLAPQHELEFSRSFTVGTALGSLNILDALGTYGFENMGSYLWTLGRFGNPGAEFEYASISISAVPEPTTLAFVLAGGGLVWLRARRSR